MLQVKKDYCNIVVNQVVNIRLVNYELYSH